MKKYLAILFLVFTICFVGRPLKVSVAEASSSPEQINARILPLVWYSTLSINDGDSIKIYTGIQNNSGINFAGTATFYVDDKEISKSPFTSEDNSLKEVSSSWVVEAGPHNMQVKIVTSLPADKTLVSYDSDISSLNITKKISIEAVNAGIINTISNGISQTNAAASTLANQIESFKKPVRTAQSTAQNTVKANSDNSKNNIVKVITSTLQKNGAAVLGASTGPISNPATTNISKMDSVFNMVMDFFAFLVRNWKWTLLGVIVLFLVLKIIT